MQSDGVSDLKEGFYVSRDLSLDLRPSSSEAREICARPKCLARDFGFNVQDHMYGLSFPHDHPRRANHASFGLKLEPRSGVLHLMFVNGSGRMRRDFHLLVCFSDSSAPFPHTQVVKQ